MVYYLDIEATNSQLEAANLLGLRDSKVSRYRNLIHSKLLQLNFGSVYATRRSEKKLSKKVGEIVE